MPYRAQFMNCASWGPGRSQPIARKSVRNWHQQRRPTFRTIRVTRRVHRSLSSFCPERAPLKRPAIVSTFSRPPCAAGGILAEFNRRAAVGKEPDKRFVATAHLPNDETNEISALVRMPLGPP